MGLLLIVRGALTAIPIAITFLDRVGYPALVDGVSMQPTLNPDSTQTDIVFLNRWTVRGYNLNHGDIVSLVSPKNPNDRLIKRVIALEGDELDTIGYKSSFLRIPDGHCWVEGDNTGRSSDSNLFGPVSLGLITARATCILWPPSRWQFLEPSLPVNRVPYKISRKKRDTIDK